MAKYIPMKPMQRLSALSLHGKPLTQKVLREETKLAESTVYMALHGYPVKAATAARLYLVFKQAGYSGQLEDLFIIGQQGARNDRHAPRLPVQRKRPSTMEKRSKSEQV